MSHSHAHGDNARSFYASQLAAVGACGTVAVAALGMSDQMFDKILVRDFRIWMTGGGILLALLVFFRMVGIALTVNSTPHDESDHDQHNHAHGADGQCETDHAHAHGATSLPMVDEETHDDHDHGGGNWRLIVIGLPFALYALQLPNAPFSNEFIQKGLKEQQLDPITRAKTQEGKPIELQFNELARAAIMPKSRALFEGRRGILRGEFNRIGEKEFTLYKTDMKCCRADQVFIKARVICDETIQRGWQNQEWVKVEGVIQFAPVKDNPNEWVPILFLDKETQIQPTEKEL